MGFKFERYKREADPAETHRDRWLISYADLVTLLLALFIVLYAASDKERAKLIAQNFNQNLSGEAVSGSGVLPGADSLISERTRIEGVLASNPFFASRAKVTQTNRGVIVSLAEAGFFASGEAEINAEAAQLVDAIAESLIDSKVNVRVEGHTDSTPISTSRYPSNWELSTARAAVVLSRLTDRGIAPERLSAAGYAGFQPIADNSTIEGRAQNRRVDIVILSK